MVEQPARAARLGVHGQAAHRQFGLLALGARHILQQLAGRRGQGGQRALEGWQGHAAHDHRRIAHGVHHFGQAEHGRGGFQPEGPFDHTQLMAHFGAVVQAEHHTTRIDEVHPG